MCDNSKGTVTYKKGSFLISCSPLITAKHYDRWLHSQYAQVDLIDLIKKATTTSLTSQDISEHTSAPQYTLY